MLFDWFTFIAQTINFLILIYLLWRFLYKPITKAMGKRQQELEERWRAADLQREEAEQAAQSYRQQQRELEERRQEILSQTQAEAEQQRRDMVNQARQDVNQKHAEWHQAIKRQQQSFLEELRQRMQAETCAVSRRALQDLANAQLEQQAIAVFLDRLQNLEDEERQSLTQVVGEADDDIVVCSSFEIPEQTRQTITSVLQQQFSNGKAIEFTTATNLICGIKLQVANREIAWNINNYLQNLEERFMSAFEQEQTEAKDRETDNDERGDRQEAENHR